MKFKNFFIFFMITAIISLVGCSSSSSSSDSKGEESAPKGDEPITLKVATFFPETSNTHTNFVNPWMEKVEELTDGKVKFDYYPSEQLGKTADMLGLTKDNVMNIAMLPTIYFNSEMPISNSLQNMPGVAESATQATMGYWDLLQNNPEILEKDYLNNGVRPLGILFSTPYEIWSKDIEIRKPEDLNGLKIKTAGGITNEFFQSLGAVPVTVAFPEMYEALDKGVVDALSIDALPLRTSGVEEVVTHGVFPHWGTSLQSLIINEQVWSSLSPEIQEAMIQAGQEVTEAIGPIYDNVSNEIIDGFMDTKTMVELTEEEQKKWTEIGEGFQKKWVEENTTEEFPIKDYLEKYKESLSKYK